MQVKIVPEYSQFPIGHTFRLGVLFKMRPGWHIYWENPGDSGKPTQVNWSMPPSGTLIVDPIKEIWPVPSRITLDTIVSYGYKKSAFVLFHFGSKVSKGKPPPFPLLFTAKVRWLECKEICLPGQATLTVRFRQVGNKLNPTFKQILRKNLPSYPKESPILHASAYYVDKSLKLVIENLATLEVDTKRNIQKLKAGQSSSSSNSKEKVYFFIDHAGILQHTLQQTYQINDDTLTLYLPFDLKYAKNAKKISGYLKLYSFDHGAPLIYPIEAKVETKYGVYITSFVMILFASLWYFLKSRSGDDQRT